jgi:hypothetical protein
VSSTLAESGFDPNTHLTMVSGKQYLLVMWRIVWFRSVYPNGQIVTEMMTPPFETNECVFKATVSWVNANGQEGKATGWGSETVGDFQDFREKAETKAVGRALALAGFGTQFAGEIEYDPSSGVSRIVDSPVQTPVNRQVNPQVDGKKPLNNEMDRESIRIAIRSSETERDLRQVWGRMERLKLQDDNELYGLLEARQAEVAKAT